MILIYKLILTVGFYLLIVAFFKIRVRGTSALLLRLKDHETHLKFLGAIVMVLTFVWVLLHKDTVIGMAYSIAAILYAVRLLSEFGFKAYQSKQ